MSRLVHFPVTRIMLYLGGIAVALWILRLTARGLAAGLGAWWPAGVASVVLPILVVHLVYRGITRALERRPAAELALRGAFRETAAGMLAGAACLTVTVGLIAALGYYHVEAIGSWTALAAALGIAATSGYIEEVIFRGVVFRIVEEALGTWSALVITVALFGLAHLGNPNASLYGAAAIGIEAGLLLGAAYVLDAQALARDRHPLRMELHAGWCLRPASLGPPGREPPRVPIERARCALRRCSRGRGFGVRHPRVPGWRASPFCSRRGVSTSSSDRSGGDNRSREQPRLPIHEARNPLNDIGSVDPLAL